MNTIPLPVDPNLNNVITNEEIAIIPIYANYSTLSKLFDVGNTAVRTLVKDMKNSAYSDYVLEIGHKTIIVNVKGFMAYLTQSKTKYHYLKQYTYADKEALEKLFNLSASKIDILIREIKKQEIDNIIFPQVFDIEIYHIKNFEQYLIATYGRLAKFDVFKG